MLTIRDGKIHDARGNPFNSAGGPFGAIFVMDKRGNIYASNQYGLGQFNHSSFLAGGPVAGAGHIRVVDGELTFLMDQSGHYLPKRKHIEQVINFLQSQGVKVDASMVKYIGKS